MFDVRLYIVSVFLVSCIRFIEELSQKELSLYSTLEWNGIDHSREEIEFQP